MSRKFLIGAYTEFERNLLSSWAVLLADGRTGI